MKNIKSINQESHATVALMVLCQDYVLADEEFMANEKIQKNMRNADFWIELAHGLHGAVRESLKVNDDEGYDECDDTSVTDNAVMDFIMDPTQRFELNDIICDSVENWLRHFGNKRFG